ncbi:uncharacterized protein LOC103570521 [Microplitis demolitor]|uniref:uncharacterized protein LOC103570521 n=1 Tax=Microplitis demolitor TaxID=69319 RepID=UPI0004CD4799|nr:uncharacterized protein LOC103570521 [Microplitis demolitor]
MKICIFVLAILACAAAYPQGEGESTVCQTHCVKAEECDMVGPGTCGDGLTCCQIVTREFRTTCRQHGGECMKESCAEHLRVEPNLADCKSEETCCILV